MEQAVGPEPSRYNKYTAAVLDELQTWLHQHGASYRYAAADPPTVAWDLPRYGTTRGRCWRITFGCNPHDLHSWRVMLAERDKRGNVYDTAEASTARGHLQPTAERLLQLGLRPVAEPSATCGHTLPRISWAGMLHRLASLGRAPR